MPRTIVVSVISSLLLVTAARAQAPVGGSMSEFRDPYQMLSVQSGPTPYWGYGPGHPVLSGAAQLLEAQGRYFFNAEKTYLAREQVRQEKLVTRRKEIEHWAWEREYIRRDHEEHRQRMREMEVRRIVNDAPPVQIYSADILNALLKELLKLSDKIAAENSVPVEKQWLAHLHVNCQNGNSGLIKADKVAWPLLLLGRADLAEDRTEVERLLARCKAAVLQGQTPARELIELRAAVDKLQRRLDREMRSRGDDANWSPGQYIAATRSLRELKGALAILERPDAGDYLNPVKGDTVAELVQHMRSNGLTFAPATWGDERFYVATYYALRDELQRVGGVPSMAKDP